MIYRRTKSNQSLCIMKKVAKDMIYNVQPKSIPNNLLITFYFLLLFLFSSHEFNFYRAAIKRYKRKKKGNFINCSCNFNVTLLSYESTDVAIFIWLIFSFFYCLVINLDIWTHFFFHSTQSL